MSVPGGRMIQVRGLIESGDLERMVSAGLSQRAIAAKLGINESSYRKTIAALRSIGVVIPGDAQPSRWPNVDAFDAGIVPLDTVPEGHVVKGVSSLVGPDGDVRQQWIKTTADDPNNGLRFIEAVKAGLSDAPRAEPIAAPEHGDDDLLVVLPIGDAHVGMLAWEPEAGGNFDLKIAERNLMRATEHLHALAPPAKRALIINVGDFVHSDGPQNTTTRGTRVDVDGRWPKVIETAIRIMRRMIDLALRRHEHVTVINARGNHDETAAVVIAIALAQFYESDPRVYIDTSPEFFHWYRFDQNLIGVHHSEKVKTPAELLGVMAVDRAKDWGETTHRRYYCGHLHHTIVKEERTVVVEWIPTLAGSDAWHRAQGYRACRELRLDVIHRKHGHINRHIVGVEQIR